jgi:hypothetical protein
LAALSEESFDLSLVGFDDDELARLLAEQDSAEGLTDEDAVPDLPEIRSTGATVPDVRRSWTPRKRESAPRFPARASYRTVHPHSHRRSRRLQVRFARRFSVYNGE